MTTDTSQRQAAINPDQSFIVQAPAGSGKTELLIQRFLALLTRVKQPESILAITFTRKAAAEMQERIVTTLQQAQDLNQPLHDFDNPQRQRLQLACQVLDANQNYEWHLLTNPQRLRIQTIDSFCHYLVSRLPITARLGAPMAMTDQPQFLYQEAIRSLITDYLNQGQPPALYDLFQHLNHQFDYIERLLQDALAQRDQWLPHIHNTQQSDAVRAYLENALQTIVHDHLERLDVYCQQYQIKQTLLQIMHHASQYHDNERVQAWGQLSDFPQPHPDNLALWQGITDICLTSDKRNPSIRRKLDKRQGFPTHSPNMKRQAQDLLAYIEDNPELSSLIKQLKNIPKPVYQANNWKLLNQLLTQILPQAVAHLTVVFQKQQTLDFQQVALQALQALGTPEQASELLMALDYQLEHILVDEFQDTSYLQFDLLRKLTTDWSQTPHKTLFLVGDPMQSIYRFRNAQVTIFLQLWQQQQLNEILLNPVTLKTNFRSSANIIDWLNQAVATILPHTTDINQGAVPGVQAQAIHDNCPSSQVLMQLDNTDEDEQAQTIQQQIQTWLSQYPNWDIAILVQKRRHLQAIIPALQAADIDYQSQDLLPLTQLPIIQDLMALTRALYYFEDRTSWLACLRAPWCGLKKPDLTILASDHQITLWQRIQSPDCWNSLSDDAQQRLRHWCQAINKALEQKGRVNRLDWIYNTWRDLQGPQCLQNQYDEQASQQFFEVLQTYSQQSIFDVDQFHQTLDQHFLKSSTHHDARVHIMTIHKAKGLEFDAVIIPSMQSPNQPPTSRLFLWSEYYTYDKQYALLAPIKQAGEDKQDQPLYTFIENLEKQRMNEENKRLLYVALTRARSALLLAAYQSNNSAKNSFLSYLNYEQPSPSSEGNNQPQSFQMQPFLKRLPDKYLLKASNQPSYQTLSNHSPQWHPPYFRIRGLLIHSMLQIISDDWQKTPKAQSQQAYPYIIHVLHQRQSLWLQYCRQYGITQSAHQLMQASQTIIDQVARDPIGQWLLAPKKWAYNEMTITVKTEQHLEHYRPDRIFWEDNGYWIIDYKTTISDEIQSTETVWAQHKDQLLQYRDLLISLGYTPIRIGIYLPLTQQWISSSS